MFRVLTCTVPQDVLLKHPEWAVTSESPDIFRYADAAGNQHRLGDSTDLLALPMLQWERRLYCALSRKSAAACAGAPLQPILTIPPYGGPGSPHPHKWCDVPSMMVTGYHRLDRADDAKLSVLAPGQTTPVPRFRAVLLKYIPGYTTGSAHPPDFWVYRYRPRYTVGPAWSPAVWTEAPDHTPDLSCYASLATTGLLYPVPHRQQLPYYFCSALVTGMTDAVYSQQRYTSDAMRLELGMLIVKLASLTNHLPAARREVEVEDPPYSFEDTPGMITVACPSCEEQVSGVYSSLV